MRQNLTIWLVWTLGSAAACACIPLLYQASLALDPTGPPLLVAAVVVGALALISAPQSLAVLLLTNRSLAARWWLATALGTLAGIAGGTMVLFVLAGLTFGITGLSGAFWYTPPGAGAIGGLALGSAQALAVRGTSFPRPRFLARLSALGGAAFALCLYVAIFDRVVPAVLWGALCGFAYALPTSLIPLRLANRASR